MTPRARLLLAGLSALTVTATPPASHAETGAVLTPAAVLASAPDADWRKPDPQDLLVMDLANGARVRARE